MSTSDRATVTAGSTPGTQGGSGRPTLGRPVRRAVIRGTLLVLFVVVAGLALWTFAALTYTYSAGERAGYLQKFSRRGWICKTWEGELAMGNLPGAMPEIFKFSVRDEASIRKLQAAPGKRVVLYYDQHVGLPTSCFGETQYFITDVKEIGPVPWPGGREARQSRHERRQQARRRVPVPRPLSEPRRVRSPLPCSAAHRYGTGDP